MEMFQNEFGSGALNWAPHFDLPSFLTTGITADDADDDDDADDANDIDDNGAAENENDNDDHDHDHDHDHDNDHDDSRDKIAGKDDTFHSEWVEMLPPLAKPPPGCDLYGVNLDDPESLIRLTVDLSASS